MDEAAPATPPHRNGCGRWLLWTCAAVLAAGGLLAWQFAGLAGETLHWLGWLPERLATAQLTETFRESVTRIASTEGDILELAVLETDETLNRSDTLRLLGDSVDLGTTISE